MDEETFNKYILEKPVPHSKFPSEKYIFDFLLRIKRLYEK